jgi:hypothetical protein
VVAWKPGLHGDAEPFENSPEYSCLRIHFGTIHEDGFHSCRGISANGAKGNRFTSTQVSNAKNIARFSVSLEVTENALNI